MLIKSRKDMEELLARGMSGEQIEISCVTHSGTFHADEVFTTAFLNVFLFYYAKAHRSWVPGYTVLVRTTGIDSPRVRDLYEEYTDDPNVGIIVYDIGMGEFDHHQIGAEVRQNHTETDPHPYAAFGLVWRELAPLIFDEKFVRSFDAAVVEPIDLQDNGVVLNPLSGVIKAMNKRWDQCDSDNPDYYFQKAVAFAKSVLDTYFEQYFSRKIAEEYLEDCIVGYNGNKFLHMKTYMPYQEYMTTNHPDVYYAVYPSNRNAGEWCLSPIDSKTELLPESWVSEKPEGCTFVHKARFIASFVDEETAVNNAIGLTLRKTVAAMATEKQYDFQAEQAEADRK